MATHWHDPYIRPIYSFFLIPHPAVYLSDGMMALPSGFSPFVEFVDESEQWRWIGKMGQVLDLQTEAAICLQDDSVYTD